jgi:UDP-N-acetylglucosamine--N-acetylmuramyl-(pentapeptide) pyrophosphoryl-undecaprenol N-acetylglucosamine transferase
VIFREPTLATTLDQTLHRLATWNRPVRLIATGGGTGGHTYPAITTIRATRELLSSAGVELDVLYVGSAGGLEARVAEQEQLPFQAVSTGKLRRAANPVRMISRENLRDVGKLARGIVEARRVVRAFRPDVVLSTGGYVAVPVGLAAKSAGAALLVHEQTTRLGLANRVLLRRATTIALSSPASLELLPAGVRARAVVTGNPIRTELLHGDAGRAVTALGWAGWDAARPTVYVTGGAQGAVQINRLVAAVLETLLAQANVVHQCGASSLTELTHRAEQLPPELAARYRVVEFVGSELPDVLALADVVVSRSGAGTLAELTALGKPSVLIPLMPTSGNEQEHNARYLQQAGAARALLGERPTTEDLVRALDDLIGDAQLRTQMAAQAAQLGRPDAARNLATCLLAETQPSLLDG